MACFGKKNIIWYNNSEDFFKHAQREKQPSEELNEIIEDGENGTSEEA